MRKRHIAINVLLFGPKLKLTVNIYGPVDKNLNRVQIIYVSLYLSFFLNYMF